MKNDSETGESFDSYQIINPYAGELNILRLDTTYHNRVISGTFWFDAVGKDGDTIRIREGRFDYEL